MDHKYTILSYPNWEALKQAIAKDLCGDSKFPYRRYIFRGQSNEAWPLKTTFDRTYGDLAFDERKTMENSLVEEFKNLCVDCEDLENFRKYTEFQLLSIGQHYGLPTRLLDWTYSLYVAVFFAFSNVTGRDENNAAIWIIDTAHEVWQGMYGVSIKTEKVAENARQKKQYGVFTLNQSPEKTIEEYVDRCSKNCNVKKALYKVIIPTIERDIVLNDLDMMGINYSNLYMGIEGCAHEAILKASLKNIF